MIQSFIIVLREVFEAALVIGIALAASSGIAGSRRAIANGAVVGILGAIGVAALAEPLSAALEGMGPDLFNAGVLLAAVAMLGWHNIWMKSHGAALARDVSEVGGQIRAGARPLAALAMVVALAVLREGAEVVLFLFGVVAGGAQPVQMLLGGAAGLAAGATIGTLLYFGLLRIPPRHLFVVTGWMILCLAAGMAAQAAAYLVQSGMLPALIEPLWDSSAFLPQDGLAGQILHALVGYDDRPSAMQVIFFATTFAMILLLARQVARRGHGGIAGPVAVAATILVVVALLAAPRAQAADKIYSPLVEEGEIALELRGNRQSDGDQAVDGTQQYKFEVEYAPRWFWLAELGGEWEEEPGGPLEATELFWENVFQLFEQGRYAVDAGILFEYAHALEDGADDKIELGALLQKALGAHVLTGNLIAERELASGSETELEYALQYRWRRGERFEPGIEWYGEFGEIGAFGALDDHAHEIGPAVFGKLPFGGGKLKYEGALLFGLTQESAAQTLRFLVEYEF